jgi:hypothetical protein
LFQNSISKRKKYSPQKIFSNEYLSFLGRGGGVEPAFPHVPKNSSHCGKSFLFNIYFSIKKVKPIRWIERSETTDQTTRSHIPEEFRLQQRRCAKFQARIFPRIRISEIQQKY